MDEKALSPGRLTAKRFFRNRLAVVGLGILTFLFLFSFIGGAFSPYGESQVFYREDFQEKEVAALQENTEYRFYFPKDFPLDTVLQAQFARFLGNADHFSYRGNDYTISKVGTDLYSLSLSGKLLALASLEIIAPGEDFDFVQAALSAYCNQLQSFTFRQTLYHLSGGDVLLEEKSVAHISRLLVSGGFNRSFREAAQKAIEEGNSEFSWEGRSFLIKQQPGLYSVREATRTRVWDSYNPPSRLHPLGTDKNGMDMLTRLMYGGRVSLVIGFLVVLLSGIIGVIFGGIAGYFGGFWDNLIMRLVDIFYCIPTTPLLIILGATLDAMRIDSQIRMVFLMLTLGFLGWPGIARLVRGQILSLREQEFITATEACGIRVSRRIFYHLLPNVVPQLIVTCTMSLGSTILTEATLSFLGLGVKFPFASWGNIMNDVANVHVLTSYWFVWIPAGLCLVLAVLGFNFVGDGLRDAFDPKMKR